MAKVARLRVSALCPLTTAPSFSHSYEEAPEPLHVSVTGSPTAKAVGEALMLGLAGAAGATEVTGVLFIYSLIDGLVDLLVG